MSSVERAAEAVRVISSRRTVRGIRFLDVGSAWGGFPIAFAQAGAHEAVGIERHGDLLELSQALLRDMPCAARMIHGDIMDPIVLAKLGTFDVITCNDVIEHVTDPWTLLRHLARALRPDGLLYVSVPNSRALTHIVADPHYSVFGLCLLRMKDAERYYDQLGFTASYDVTEFYRLPEYLQGLKSEGLQPELVDEVDVSTSRINALARAVDTLHRTSAQRIDSLAVEQTTRELLRRGVEAYVADFNASYGAWQESAEPASMGRDLLFNYEIPVWRILSRVPKV
jgi:SAM-dependent methyltransferase